MRLHDLTRYIDFDAITDRLDRLQGKIGELRYALPEARQIRDRLPSYRDVRKRLPMLRAQRPRGYTLPAALILGGVVAVGAIAVTSIAIRNAHRQTPKRNGDMA